MGSFWEAWNSKLNFMRTPPSLVKARGICLKTDMLVSPLERFSFSCHGETDETTSPTPLS